MSMFSVILILLRVHYSWPSETWCYTHTSRTWTQMVPWTSIPN